MPRMRATGVRKSWATLSSALRMPRINVETLFSIPLNSLPSSSSSSPVSRIKRYVERLKQCRAQSLTRDQLLMKVGAARQDAGRAASLIQLTLPQSHEAVTPDTFRFELDRDKLRQVRRREDRYLLRTNLSSHDPAQLWTFYIQLTEVEQAFEELKHDLAIRPISHYKQAPIHAPISP